MKADLARNISSYGNFTKDQFYMYKNKKGVNARYMRKNNQ